MKKIIIGLILSIVTNVYAKDYTCLIVRDHSLVEDRTNPAPGYKIQVSNGGYYRMVTPNGYESFPDNTMQEAIAASWWYYDREYGTKTWEDVSISNFNNITTNCIIADICVSDYIIMTTNSYLSERRTSATTEEINTLCKQGDICKVKGHCWSDYELEISSNTIITKKRTCKLCGALEK